MPVTLRLDKRGTAPHLIPPVKPVDGVGVYLTDGVFLYRLTAVTMRGADAIAELEDCYGLDVVPVPMRDLHARRLRVVTPSLTG